MDPVPPASASMFAPLAVRNYRFLFAGMVVSSALMPLQFVAQIFWIQEHAPEDLRIILVGLIGTMRGLGMLGFGLFGGALADRFDRRRLLVATQSMALVLNVTIASLMFFTSGQTWALALFFPLSFLASGMFSVNGPTRQALVPDLLGPTLTPGGVALNAAGMQVAMPVAVFAAGLLVEGLGFGGTYALSGLGHLFDLLMLRLIAYRPMLAPRQASERRLLSAGIDDIRAGIAYTGSDRTLLWVIGLMVVTIGLGFPAVANLGPTWITTVVGQPYRNFGFIAITWGMGSLFVALALARFPRYSRNGLLVSIGAAGFALSFLVFSIGHTVPFAVSGNLGLGASMSLSQVAATSFILKRVRNEYRGRVMSLMMLNIGVAQVITLPLAALGQAITLEVLFPSLAVACLAAVGLILLTQPQVRAARSDEGRPIVEPPSRQAAAPAD